MRRAVGWTFAVVALVAAVLAAGDWVLWRSEPHENTRREHFDVILVLGRPSEPDGSIEPEQRERVLEGVKLWRAGVAPRLVMSGGAAHNRWVEAHTMALYAVAQGVPAADVLEEGRSQNTIENVANTLALMRAHGWSSAVVVSSWYHVPRAGRILTHFPLEWRTDAAPWPAEESWRERWTHNWKEATYDIKLRVFGFPPSPLISRY